MSLERLSSNFVHRYVTSSVHLTMTNYPIMDVAGLRDPMFTFEVPLSLERVKVGTSNLAPRLILSFLVTQSLYILGNNGQYLGNGTK